MSGTPPDRILKLTYAYREAKTLLSAAELGVFTALAERPLDLDELTKRIRIDQRGARDFFDALVALKLLTRDDSGRYACTEEAALYLDREKPGYWGDELEFNSQLYARWNLLTRGLKSGRPQNAAGPKAGYADLYADRNALEIFAKAMSAATLSTAKAIATAFPWRDYRTFIDIGSAEGCLPVHVALVHAHLAGRGFDLPAMKPLFEEYVLKRALSDRVRFHPGDFFQDSLPGADVLVMGRVLHNWDLATKKMLLKKAYDAIPARGAVIVYERLIDDDRRDNAMSLLSSLNMLLLTEGGFDFTAADCVGWMRETGFRDVRVEPLASDQTMIFGLK